MKNLFLITFLLLTIFTAEGQNKLTLNKIVLTSENKKTQITINENGQLFLNVSPENILKFKAKGVVLYSDFGAKGDGKTDDMDAIAATHAFANEHNLLVAANQDATYFISGKERTAIIQTDTDFGSAAFIIDDTDVQNRTASIFVVSSNFKPYALKGISSLQKNQKKIAITLTQNSVVTVTNASIKQYIRFGLNQNNGSPKKDTFIVNKDGMVDENTPIIWNFNEITTITAMPIDQKTLLISGGVFTTIANKVKSTYGYYKRNISIKRSNVVVDGLKHYVTKEGEYGAPYGGFIDVQESANVTIKNTLLTGHKTYKTIGSAGKPVSMGTYDILVNGALNISFINCSQTNDINDRKFWGIMGSNHSKNILFDGCTFSRFDAHQGVANATIRNSTLGHMGINAIGSGVFTIENSTVRSRSFINLRRDYGSSWEGEFIIRNCIFVPMHQNSNNLTLINASNTGQHNFGYTAYMPEKITFEDFYVDGSNFSKNNFNTFILANFNPEMTDTSYIEKYPYIRTKIVILKNATTSNGKEFKISTNPFLYKHTKIIKN